MLLTIDDQASTIRAESIGAEFIRFEYDIEKAAKAIEARSLPDAYADIFRKGC